MATQKGLLVTCERCEATTFRKYIGTGETDGGYTTWDKFEPTPNDWLYVTGIGYLCPNCAYKFRLAMFNFINQDKIPEDWRIPLEEN